MITALLLFSVTLWQQTPAPKISFSKEFAWKHLVDQCDFGTRVPGTAPHVKCRDYIADHLRKFCDDVALEPFTHHWTYDGSERPMWNIVGRQNWDNAKVRIALFTHWDTRPFASQERDQDKAKKPILGADDGASGTAVLMELARIMKVRRPAELGIEYVCVDGEDLGPSIDEMFLGAVYHSEHFSDPKPDYGILLDMIGNEGVRVPMEPNSYSAAKPLLSAFYGKAQQWGYGSVFPQDWGPEILDDHLSINKAGVPTIDLIDFSYPQWHTLDDTPEHCSADSLGKIGGMLQKWLTQQPVWRYPK